MNAEILLVMSESWANEMSGPNARGRTMAIYTGALSLRPRRRPRHLVGRRADATRLLGRRGLLARGRAAHSASARYAAARDDSPDEPNTLLSTLRAARDGRGPPERSGRDGRALVPAHVRHLAWIHRNRCLSARVHVTCKSPSSSSYPSGTSQTSCVQRKCSCCLRCFPPSAPRRGRFCSRTHSSRTPRFSSGTGSS